jgi:tetraacyldisaccharide-1-P 4'-kinase
MNKVVLDDDLRAKLNGLNDEVEVCDAEGRTIGRFLPEQEYRSLIYDLAKADFTIDAEAEEARKEPGGMTTAEAVAYVERVIESHRQEP